MEIKTKRFGYARLNVINSSQSPSPFGGTKDAEYRRTIEMFEEIYSEKGLFYALAFLYDSQYDRQDILAIMEILKPGKGRLKIE
jgi:hypothetical protein